MATVPTIKPVPMPGMSPSPAEFKAPPPTTWTPKRGEMVDFYGFGRVKSEVPRLAYAYPCATPGTADVVVLNHPVHDGPGGGGMPEVSAVDAVECRLLPGASATAQTGVSYCCPLCAAAPVEMSAAGTQRPKPTGRTGSANVKRLA